MSESVLYAVEGAVVTITFNRPQARNAFTLDMYRHLEKLLHQVTNDPSLRAIILTGAGTDAFAAGTDIAEFRAFSGPDDAIAYEDFIDRLLTALESCRIPTIAAIEGACTGGGAAIAARCDLRIASDHLRFGFPIARTLGNCLSQANLAQLASLIGAARVKDIILTARLIEAPEALTIGLINEILPKGEVLQRAQALAQRIASHAPLTLYATKEGLRRARLGLSDSDRDLITLCYSSADFREGMEAFLAKRAANWQGR